MFDHHREYELTVRQEPKQARMCGVGGKSLPYSAGPSLSPTLPADRRPIDPPPIIQLRVVDPHARQPPSPANPDAEDADPNYAHSFLQNPYYFMFASLAKPDDDTELHWLKVRLSTLSSPPLFHPVPPRYRMAKHDALPVQSFPPYIISKIPRIATKTLAFSYFQISVCAPKVATVLNSVSLKSSGTSSFFFTFPSLIYPHSNTVRHCKSIHSAAFYVYTAKKFPGMEGWLPLA